jgi:hypothetical protein
MVQTAWLTSRPPVSSLPLQLFPAVRIMENGLFSKSGKHNPQVSSSIQIARWLSLIVDLSKSGQVAEEHIPGHDGARMFPHLLGWCIQFGRLCQLYWVLCMVRPLLQCYALTELTIPLNTAFRSVSSIPPCYTSGPVQRHGHNVQRIMR